MISFKNKVQKFNLYGPLIFLSAFLLFQIQPVISRYILPWFGGSSTVWLVALVFFQVTLLAGYAFAHFLIYFFKPRLQLFLYLVLLAISVLLLPVTPSDIWKNYASDSPILAIFVLLIVHIGLPYFILAATSPLLQAWFSQAFPKKIPYRLYSLSNVGSLLGLIIYPFIIEPFLGVRFQTYLWSAGFVLFVFIVILFAIQTAKTMIQNSKFFDNWQSIKRPPLRDWFGWLIFPALASGMLLATTNYLTQDIAVVPMLWIIPLIIYLTSFIITFQSDRFYDRLFFVQIFILTSITLALVLWQGLFTGVILMVILFSVVLFFYTLICHAELYKLKPHPKYLTSFYLMISLGGALGGIFVALVAPLIFPAFFELHFLVIACYLLLIIILFNDKSGVLFRKKFTHGWLFIIIGFILVSYLFGLDINSSLKKPFYIFRDFYGVVRIFKVGTSQNVHKFLLYNGSILHGSQFFSPQKKCLPTTYYTYDSGVGIAFEILKNKSSLNIGAIGLGAGTIAAYADGDSRIRFYELNPKVKEVAEQNFTFLSECANDYEVIVGDARISLEKEKPQNFDILVLDAFSSDTIPVHLLTKESFKVYLKHLKSDGILAIHISSRFINLKPVVAALADNFDLAGFVIKNGGDEEELNKETDQSISTWALLSPDADLLDYQDVETTDIKSINYSSSHLWTDDYSNLFWVIKF